MKPTNCLRALLSCHRTLAAHSSRRGMQCQAIRPSNPAPMLNAKAVQSRLHSEKCVFVDGESMRRMLAHFGALEEDLEELKALQHQMPADPTISEYRDCSRDNYSYDPKTGRIEEVVSHGMVLVKDEGYKRFDSDIIRHFGAPPQALKDNSFYRALHKFKAFVTEDLRAPPRKYTDNRPGEKRLIDTYYAKVRTDEAVVGEPAKEGVHSDGCLFTMTVLVDHTNLHPSSAISRIHTNAETTGVHWSETKAENLLLEHQLWDPLDTLVFRDNEIKHSVSEVHQLDEGKEANRSMMLFLTKDQPNEVHASYGLDTAVSKPGGVSYYYK